MVERQLVTEYVNEKYPNAVKVFYNLRMGRPPEQVLRRYPGTDPKHFKVWQGYADAVIVEPTLITILEGKVWHPRNAVAQLAEYYNNAGNTDELKPFLPRPVLKLLVTAIASPATIDLCRQFNVKVEVFRPQWLIPILQERGYM